MNCLYYIHRSSALPLQGFKCNHRRKQLSSLPSPSSSLSFNLAGISSSSDIYRNMNLKAISGSASSADTSSSDVKEEKEKSEIYSHNMTEAMDDNVKEEKEKSEIYSHNMTEAMGADVEEKEKSEIYSHNMTEAMGAVLTYRHELGMNYNVILPDLIVGSCLQTPEDVDKLRKIGVKTIFCLQQDPDLEYFGVDISAIRDYAKECGNIQHLRAEIRDFDSFDLRIQLPAVVSKLCRAINQNGGVTYIHCTAGLGRAPAVAMAYMFWFLGYKLSDAHDLLLSKRSCFPKLDAIKSATADILTGLRRRLVTLTWKHGKCSTVEISGLDIGWGQRIPLKFDKERALWILKRELLEGRYEYKYIIDGEWTYNKHESVALPNKDGHVNNYVQVVDEESDSTSAAIRKRLTGDDPDLTTDEWLKIQQFLGTYPEDE